MIEVGLYHCYLSPTSALADVSYFPRDYSYIIKALTQYCIAITYIGVINLKEAVVDREEAVC